jgi:hypothetical protein
MSGRTLALALVVATVAPAAWAAQARSHGGAASHSGSTAVPRGGAGPTTPAQGRQPRPGTGTGPWYGYGHGYGYGYRYPYYGYGYYRGYYPWYGYGYYPYWNTGIYLGLGGYYGGAYYDSGYYGGGGYVGGYDAPNGYAPDAGAYDSRGGGEAAAIRTLVEPEKTKVYVDGYLSGVADDFDGMGQRLYVPPGRHELTFKLEGYRTHHVVIYVAPGSSVKIYHDMVKGDGPDTQEDLSGGQGQGDSRHAPGNEYQYGQAPRPDPSRAYAPPPPRDSEPDMNVDIDAPGARSQSAGLVSFDVSPIDASVYVDGQFRGSVRQAGQLELGPGRHRIEIVRPGYRTLDRDVMVESGKAQTVSATLERHY